MKNGIYTGEVYHGRHIPFSHKFRYRVFAFLVNIDDLNPLHKNLRFFSFNRWNITSLHTRNHGARDGAHMRHWIESAARDKNINLDDGQIYLLAFPRLWGVVFNPISIYFCCNKDGKLTALLYQVKNTFGEQHGYLIPVEPDMHQQEIKQETEKLFYVSPFIEMNCTYHFRLTPPDDEGFHLAIHQFLDEQGKILTATWNGGVRQELTDTNILKTVLKTPLMTFKVIFGIHWQALKIWLKGARFLHRKPKSLPDVT